MPNQNVKTDKKGKLLDAALEAYARHGIHDATTRQIAEIAGVGKSTIFEYFKSSSELMDAAFAHYIAQAAAQRERLRKTAQLDPVAALSAYFDDLISLILHEPGKLLLVSQYVTAILATGKDFSEVKNQYAQKLQPSASSLLDDFKFIAEAGCKSGAFQPINQADSLDCALMMNAIAREMQSQAFVQDESSIMETCQRLKSMVFRMLGARIETI